MEATHETSKSCRITNCRRPYRAKGYCNVHYKKWRQGEIEGAKPRYRICGEENCRKPTFKKGMCEQHYLAWSASKKGQPTEKPLVPAAAETPPETAEVKPAETNSQ